jgi:predicted component of type VI protein secretion system
MPFLEHEETTRELKAGDTLIGSGSQADWRLQNVDLAARHFSVAVTTDGRVVLKPYSAQNVVVINGRQVPLAGVALSDGDVIAAGLTRFSYVADPNRPRAAAAQAAARAAAWLINENERTAYPLKKKTVSIGRDAASHVAIREPSVSRFHADVRAEAGEHVLYAMGSAGTRINGHGVSAPQLLEEGDQIEVGTTVLRFTHTAPPAGFNIVHGPDEPEDSTTRRATVVAAQAVTAGEIPSYRGAAPGRFLIPIALGVAALIAVAAWLLAR